MSEPAEKHDSLATALPAEVARVRDEVLPCYLGIGLSGMFAATLMRQDLDAASKAMIEGDTVEMIRIYQRLKSWNV